MSVDVETVIEIARPRAEVAAYACDPDNVTAWYRNIKRVEWETSPPVAVGSRIAFEAAFLGRRLVYTYQVRELEPGERMVMSTSDGPFAMETVYGFRDSGEGLTEMRLRNRGEPSGFSRLTAPFMAAAMRRANLGDLRRLKEILELSGSA